jgi:membrane fusion protein, multidrug efflux system
VNKYTVAGLIVMGLIACSKSPSAPNGGAANGATPAPKSAAYAVTSVEGFVVRPTALSEQVSAPGTLLPLETTELHPEVSGRVIQLNLPEGRAVRKGELLLKVNDEDLKTQIRRLETQLSQAQITEQRLAELLKVRGVSQQEYDLAVLATQNLRNEIELVNVNIRKTELRAPYDGVLGLRQISPGAYVTPATIVTTIRSNRGLKLDFSIPERYSSTIRTGQVVDFKVDGRTTTLRATVRATEQSITDGARDLRVRAEVSNPPADLLPGAFAEVALALGQKNQALMIPSQAVVPQARDKKVFVSRGGKVQSVTVKTGVRQTNMIEITDGLQSGDTIATTGILFLKPDAAVKFSKVD